MDLRALNLVATVILFAVSGAHMHQLGVSTKVWQNRKVFTRVDAEEAGCQLNTLAQLPIGATVVDVASWLPCINTVKIDYKHGIETIASLRDFFREYYVFVHIARDPVNSSFSSAYDFAVFSEKIDLSGELEALARSFPVNQPIGLADLQLPINELFNRLRDAHVSLSNSNVFGGVLARYFTLVIWDEGKQDYILFFQGAEVLYSSGASSGVVKSINGATFLEWVAASLAASPIFPSPYKSLGARVNDILQSTTAPRFPIGLTGNLSRLQSTTYSVRFSDNSTTTWRWAIYNVLGNNLTSSVPTLTMAANAPGLPYQAWTRAIQIYDNITWSTPPPPQPQVVRKFNPGPLVGQALSPLGMQHICCGSDGNIVGEYAIYPDKGYAVFKLLSFGLSTDVYKSAWARLVNESKAAGITHLLYDLVHNGGGNVITSYSAVSALYPDATVFYQYDRAVGPAGRYLITSGLYVTALDDKFSNRFPKNGYNIQKRAAYISANSSEMNMLVVQTNAAFAFISTLFNLTLVGQEQEGCNFDGSCYAAWQNILNTTLDLGKTLATSMSDGFLDTNELADIFDGFLGALRVVNPYTTPSNASGALSDYLNMQYHLRGGINNTYTSKYSLDTTKYNTEIQYKGPAHPFKKIIAVTDALCGSACDTFSSTAWFYSKTHPQAPSFRFATYGGTGRKEDITPTSFPGGNENDDDFLSQGWAYYMLAYTLGAWADSQDIMDMANTYRTYLPVYPYHFSRTPAYTQSEIYHVEMGPNSLPMEYYQYNPDFYIKLFFKIPADANLNLDNPALPMLYNAAAAFFD